LVIGWRRPDGASMSSGDWPHARAFNLLVADADPGQPHAAIAILINGTDSDQLFRLPPASQYGQWRLAWSSANDRMTGDAGVSVSATSVAVLLSARDATDNQWRNA
jgi:hypothetical protein